MSRTGVEDRLTCMSELTSTAEDALAVVDSTQIRLVCFQVKKKCVILCKVVVYYKIIIIVNST